MFLQLRKEELADLARETNETSSLTNLHIGETLDYAEVQQRAMDVHGGFAAHNKL